VNITGYIEKIKELENKQPNELLKMQTADYRKFIEELIAGGSIMNKNFYVIVPYYPLIEIAMLSEQFKETITEPSQEDLLGTNNTKIENKDSEKTAVINPSLEASKKPHAKLTEKQFKLGKYQLRQRLEYVALGLRRSGLRAVALGSEELIELLWSFHNPHQAEQGYYPQIPPELIN
jgi:hypothetical protein